MNRIPPAAGNTPSQAAERNPRTATPAKPASADPHRLLAHLDISVPPVQVPAGYGVAMAALVAFLALITVAYVALVAFLAWLFVWHLFQTFVSFQHGPYFLFHIPMALLGGLLLLFLVKPVFFRQHRGHDGVVTLRQRDEPLLFAFVEKLCAATGARVPAIIEVDCEPNAGARLHRRGIAGGFGKELVLRIGLPLVSALSVRQFAGVLAHELGHFNQRGGMTSAHLIRLAIAFFAKVVFERDRLDEILHRLRRSNSLIGRVTFWLAAWIIEAARGVLWLMLIVGELLTCGVLRRMEYEADRVEAHVAGAREFVRTSKLLVFLSIASRHARENLADAWNQRRLAEDLPALVVAHAKQLAEHRDDILKFMQCEKTRWFDTHPCYTDRVRNVEALGAAGLVACDVPAKGLFADFAATCRRSTDFLYRALLGPDIEEAKLVPTRELMDQRAGERGSFQAMRRFFRDGVAGSRPIFPGSDALQPVPGRGSQLAEDLAAARHEMLERADAASLAADAVENSAAQLAVSRAQISLTGLGSSPAAYKIRREAEQRAQTHEPGRARAIHNLLPFEKAARRRLTAAVRLGLSANPPDPARARMAELVHLCHAIQPHLDDVNRLRDLALEIHVHMGAYDDKDPFPPLVQRIIDRGTDAVCLLTKVRDDVANIPYPFAHAVAGASVATALVPRIPDANDPGAVHAAAMSAVDSFYDLTYRSLAELTEFAERVEKSIGLEPLPDLPRRKQQEADEAGQIVAQRAGERRYWLGYGLRAAGGMAMLFLLVRLSVSPPALPAFGWGGSGGGSSSSTRERYTYRPASFDFSSRSYRKDYHSYAPPPTPVYSPRHPQYNQPYRDPQDPRDPRPQDPRPQDPRPDVPNPNNRDANRARPTDPRYRPSQQPQRPTPPGPYRPSNPTPGRPSSGSPSPGAPSSGRR